MDVTRFRPRKPGPELRIEDAVVNRIRHFFPRTWWAAGSLPLGAGQPDLVLVRCEPQLLALANGELTDFQILAYLRAVNHARVETIAERIGKTTAIVHRSLNDLMQADAVGSRRNSSYRLSDDWHCILPEVVTIEAKVANWRKAVDQASRNSIFAHHSFVALPERVAKRVASEPLFGQLGIGLMSVDENDEVTILHEFPKRRPRVWSYYYQLAFLAARHLRESEHAVCRVDCRRSEALS